MRRVKVLILGGGPAGLSAGYELIKNSIKDFIIIEADSQVGGASKTLNFNGYYFDIGPHRFFSKIKDVNNLWKNVLGKDFIRKKRLTRIYFNERFFDYPLNVKNTIRNLGVLESFLCLLSFLKSKVKPYQNEENLKGWICNRFGERIYSKFFKIYTEKVWGIPARQINSQWACQRIKDLSLKEILLDNLPFSKSKNHIKTLIKNFYYPKYGAGMFYDLLSEYIKNKKGTIFLNSKIIKIDRKGSSWIVSVKDSKGKIKKYFSEFLISSIPLTQLIEIYSRSEDKIKEMAKKLNYRSHLAVCLVLDQKNKIPDNWIYIHDPRVKMSRLFIMNNWSQNLVKNIFHSSYGAEYFCTEGDNLWNLQDKKLIRLAVSELRKLKLISQTCKVLQGNVIRYKKAYPVYDNYYLKNIKKIKEFIKSLPNLQVIGRYGMFSYNNMDHSIYTGMLAARNILFGDYYDIWSVNQDEEYHEAKN